MRSGLAPSIRIMTRSAALAALLCAGAAQAAEATTATTVTAATAPIERELHIVATVEATQDWKKNDPKYPGEQWSRGTTRQRYEITTRLRSDGKLELRNLLHPDLHTRLEAKTIHLARQAKKQLDASGKPIKIPQTEQEKSEFMLDLQRRMIACEGEPTCFHDTQMQAAAIMAAIEYPEAMEEDSEPGRYQYFLPYKGCPEKSRVTLTMNIEGVRYNKSSDTFVPFSERRSADTVDASDGLMLCAHFLAVIDTQDKERPMYQETIFVPRPEGITEFTENNHTSREKQYQPMPTAAVDWMTEVLRHAPAEGSREATLPLPLSLNGNSTWLGLWTGTAKISMQWSFREVPESGASPRP